MKKNILAMAVLAACASTASAQTSVTIYGVVDAGVTHTTNDGAVGDRTTVEAGQLQVSRWGIRGTEDLGGGMKARFGLEGTLLNDTGIAGVGTGVGGTTTALFDREATVGIGGAFGSIDIGRQNILGVGSVGLADPLDVAFAATNPNVLFGAMNHSGVYGTYGANGGGSALRQSNSIKYVSPIFSGFGFALMRAFGEQGNGIQKSSYQGASAFYNAGPFGAAGAYARMKNNLNTDLLTSYGVGLKFAMPTAVIRGTYIANEFDNSDRKIAVYGVGVDIPLSPAMKITGAAYNTKLTDPTGLAGRRRDDSQQYHILGKYALSKRSVAYAGYSRANTDSLGPTLAEQGAGAVNLAQGFVTAGSDESNRFTVGVMHAF